MPAVRVTYQVGTGLNRQSDNIDVSCTGQWRTAQLWLYYAGKSVSSRGVHMPQRLRQEIRGGLVSKMHRRNRWTNGLGSPAILA
jgi:hypothetical protein